ncbi:hypothetical protein BT93_D1855 [Corymbia citriodora subsp. variegata]|nr:hypothetical protein BT93_D1855 [Corymbia citriodora subsp. variegata]
MPLVGPWRLMHASLLLFVLFSAFHLWACREYCRATAARTLPSSPSPSSSSSESSLDDHVEVKQVYLTDTNAAASTGKEEITLHSNAGFSGRPSASSHAVDNSTEHAFEDSNRSVPSGPDPLHN